MATVPYADTSFATSYFAERLGTEAWDNAGATNQGKALIQATRLIDTLPLVLAKTVAAQEHEFPRNGETAIPIEVKEATCEIALALLQGKTPDAYAGASGLASQTVGDVSESYRGNGKAAILTENAGLPSPMAYRLLAPWIRDNNEIELQRV